MLKNGLFLIMYFYINTSNMTPTTKPIIGITCGDLNGIGTELIIKVFSDNRILELCTPVIFSSNKVINFYRKTLPEFNFNWQNIKDLSRLNAKQMNIYNCWEEDVNITPGQLTESGGKYAVKSLQAAVHSLKQNQIEGLVTAPIHKKNVQSVEFNYTGHTPFLKSYFGVNDVVMLLFANEFRVALVTEHIPVNEVAANISKEIILRKVNILNESLKKDFGIQNRTVATLNVSIDTLSRYKKKQ